MSKRKPKETGEWFGSGMGSGGLFDEPPKSVLAKPPDPELAMVLGFLREGPKHRDWLRVRVTDPAGVVEKLRAKGHVIKSVTFPHRSADWVYCLSENGRLCGVEGKAGEDPDTAPKTKAKS